MIKNDIETIWHLEMKRAVLMRAIDEVNSEIKHKEETIELLKTAEKIDLDKINELRNQTQQYYNDLNGWTNPKNGIHHPGLMENLNELSQQIIGMQQRVEVVSDILKNKKVDGL